MKGRFVVFCSLAFLVLTTGAAQSPKSRPASTKPPLVSAPAPSLTPVPAPTDAATAVPSPNYVIGPGDVLQVFVWRYPEQSGTYPVRPDGKVTTPLVEDMVAAGKTSTQLARDMEQVLKEYLKEPQVNIIIATAANIFSQVKVIGQVRAPQSLPYRDGMTVLDAILAVGGLTEFAAGNRAKLIRKDESGNASQRKLRLNDLMNKARASEDIALQPGDVLIVPEAMF